MFINNYFGIQKLDKTGQRFILKSVFLRIIIPLITITLSNTFFALYLLSEVSDAQFGLLLSIEFLLALLIDYPSSALSDTIGQKFILLVTCFMYAIAYTLITLPTNLLVLIIAFFLFGFGDGFFYGSLHTWYSINY